MEQFLVLKNLKLEHAWTAHENPDIDVLTNGAMVNGIAGIPALQTLQIQWVIYYFLSQSAALIPRMRP